MADQAPPEVSPDPPLTVSVSEAQAYVGVPPDAGTPAGLDLMIPAAITIVREYLAPNGGDLPEAAPRDLVKLCVMRVIHYLFAHSGGNVGMDGAVRPADVLRVTGCVGLLSQYRVRGAVT